MRFFSVILFSLTVVGAISSQPLPQNEPKISIGADLNYHAVNSSPAVFDRSEFGETPLSSFGLGGSFVFKLLNGNLLIGGFHFQKSRLELNRRTVQVYSEVDANFHPDGSVTNSYVFDVPALFGGLAVETDVRFFKPDGVTPFQEGDPLNFGLILGSEINTLNIPILYHVEFGKNEKKIALFLEGGFEFVYAIGEKLNLDGSWQYGLHLAGQRIWRNYEWLTVAEIDLIDIQSLFEEQYRKTNLLGTVNFGTVINPDGLFSLHIGLGYSHSLFSANKNTSSHLSKVALMARAVYRF